MSCPMLVELKEKFCAADFIECLTKIKFDE